MRRRRAPAPSSRRRRACSSAAARRRCCRRRRWRGSSTRSTASPGAEVTVECNPDSVDEAKLRGYAAAGREPRVDRRAVDAGARARLARAHPRSRQRARAPSTRRAPPASSGSTSTSSTARPASASTTGRPRSTPRSRSSPTHVSAYALTVEPGTPLGKAVAAGTRAAPDDDDQALKYELADDRLAAAGFGWYEISNWARPGEECRHNLLYWRGGEYAGIGCAAHGHTATAADGSSRRWWNVRTPERYVAAVAAGEGVEAADEVLDAPAAGGGAARARAPHPRRDQARRPEPMPRGCTRASTSSPTPGS